MFGSGLCVYLFECRSSGLGVLTNLHMSTPEDEEQEQLSRHPRRKASGRKTRERCRVDRHPRAALRPGVTLQSSLFAGSPVNSFVWAGWTFKVFPFSSYQENNHHGLLISRCGSDYLP